MVNFLLLPSTVVTVQVNPLTDIFKPAPFFHTGPVTWIVLEDVYKTYNSSEVTNKAIPPEVLVDLIVTVDFHPVLIILVTQ